MEPNEVVIPPVRPKVYNSDAYSPKNLVTTEQFVEGVKPLNKYDLGLREGLNQAYTRGANQSGLQQIGNAALRAIPSVAAKIGEGFAGTISLVSEAAKSVGTGKGID